MTNIWPPRGASSGRETDRLCCAPAAVQPGLLRKRANVCFVEQVHTHEEERSGVGTAALGELVAVRLERDAMDGAVARVARPTSQRTEAQQPPTPPRSWTPRELFSAI